MEWEEGCRRIYLFICSLSLYFAVHFTAANFEIILGPEAGLGLLGRTVGHQRLAAVTEPIFLRRIVFDAVIPEKWFNITIGACF